MGHGEDRNMSKQRERERFFMDCARLNISETGARCLLRYAATAQRLSEAGCNGDYPAGNGARKTKECPECECGWAPQSFKVGVCPDCYNGKKLEKYVDKLRAGGATVQGVILNGDPRGYVVKLVVKYGEATPYDPKGEYTAAVVGVPS